MSKKAEGRTCHHRLVGNFLDKAFPFGLSDVKVEAGGEAEKSEEEADGQHFDRVHLAEAGDGGEAGTPKRTFRCDDKAVTSTCSIYYSASDQQEFVSVDRT